MSKNGAVRKWLTSLGFDARKTMESVLCLFLVAFIPTEEPSELLNRSGKSPFLARQKNAACAHTSRKILMPLRVCPGGVALIKTSICNTNFLL